MQCEECFDRSVRFFIHVVASLKGLFSFVVNIRCLDLICLIELLLTVHPLLVIDLPTCLLYFTILSHKPRVHLSKICHSLRSLWDWKAFQTCFDMIWLNYCALCILYWLSTCLLVYFISRPLRINYRFSINLVCIHLRFVIHCAAYDTARLFSLDLIWFDWIIVHCASFIGCPHCLLVYFISRSLRINLVSVCLSSVSWSVGGSSYTGRW